MQLQRQLAEAQHHERRQMPGFCGAETGFEFDAVVLERIVHDVSPVALFDAPKFSRLKRHFSLSNPDFV